MSLHQFATDGRKRLTVSQSKTEPGKVVLQLLDSAREVIAVYSMDAATAAVIGQAFDIEARAAESLADSVRLAGGLAAGVSGVAGNGGEALKLSGRFAGLCDPGEVLRESVQACGRGVISLPVVDVPQVSGLCKLIDKINAERVGA